MYAAAIASGVGLGIAAPLTLSGIVEVAPPEARGTAMTLRITGNRIGLVVMPFAAGLIAAITGVAGILVLTALSLPARASATRPTRAATRSSYSRAPSHFVSGLLHTN